MNEDKNHEMEEFIKSEKFNERVTNRDSSLKRVYASANGIEFNEILSKMSPVNPQCLIKKQSIFQRIASFVEKVKEVGKKGQRYENIDYFLLNRSVHKKLH